MKKIDFYIDVIDNFGDLGFAVNLALIIDKNENNTVIRFFSNNEKIFNDMIKDNTFIGKIKYYDLSEIKLFEPNSLIFNFFDKKIDFDFLNSKDLEIKIINFGYFLLHDGVEKLHLTNYRVKNIEVTHFIPSLLEGTGGVLINKPREIVEKDKFIDIISKKYDLFLNIKPDYKIVSIFVYKETLDSICDVINKENTNTFFFIFGYPSLFVKNDNVKVMPFLELNDYNDFLSICDINFVRGENSLINSIIYGKPTLWDIYKENNKAHIEKIKDFLKFLSSIEDNDKNYDNLLKSFNETDIKQGFLEFLNNYKNYENMFNSLGNYVNKNCDLYKKIKEILN